MPTAEIDVRSLKAAVEAILDHVLDDLKMEKVPIEENLYWTCSAPEKYVTGPQPTSLEVGSLVDDLKFASSIRRGQAGDISYNLVHVAPLLLYLAEKVKK